jgi:Flp pilus assembly protein TadD
MRRKLSRSRHKAETAGVTASPLVESVEPEIDEPVESEGALLEPSRGSTPEAVIAHWRNAVLSDPTNVAARRRLARALEAHGEAALAVEQLESARSQQPDDVGLIVELAQMLTGLRRFDQAERELKRAAKLEPDNAEVQLALGVISLRRGL